jgi:hypothetical protein
MVTMQRPIAITALGVIAASTLLLGIPSLPAQAVTVSVAPPDTTVNVGDEVILTVSTTTFADLKAFKMIYQYDPAVLELVEVLPGDMLTTAIGGFLASERSEYAAPLDTVWYEGAIVGFPLLSSGSLAFIRFRLVGEGSSDVTCQLMEFIDSSSQLTTPACTDAVLRAFSTPPPLVWIDPPDTVVDITQTATLRVMTDAVSDLKAYELIFKYDPTYIELLSVSPGDLLTTAPGGYTDFQRLDFVSPQDSVWYDAAVLLGSTSGPGILAYLDFRALTEGDSPIECRLVDFRDSFNSQTLPPCTGGILRVVGPVQVLHGTWGRLKSTYR